MFHLREDNTLFLFIDFQEKLMPAMFENEKVIENARKAFEFSKMVEIPSLFTTQYKKGLGKLVEDFSEVDDKTMDKTEFSCYKNPDIKKVIDDFNVENVVLFGQETHICAFQTARDLLEANYNVFVAHDAMTSRTFENKDSALKQLRFMGANIVSLELIIFDVLSDSKNPHFKEAQALIK